MNYRNSKIMFNVALISYTVFLGCYLLLFLTKCFSHLIEPIVYIVIIPVLCGLFPVFFVCKGFMWARYFLGIFATLGCLWLLFLPLTLHSHERTLLFYLILIWGLLTFGFNIYMMVIHKGNGEPKRKNEAAS